MPAGNSGATILVRLWKGAATIWAGAWTASAACDNVLVLDSLLDDKGPAGEGMESAIDKRPKEEQEM
jgi:hypothetical protein